MPTKQTTRYPATNSTERNKMKTTKELLESITKSKVARRNKLTGGNPKRDISSQEVKDQMAASVKATLDKFEQEKKAEAAKKIGVRKESDESTLTQALDILEDLESEEEILEFLETLDEDIYAEVASTLDDATEVEDELNEDQDAIRAKIASLQADLKAVKGNAPGDARNRGLISSELRGLKQQLRGKNESTLERAISNYRELSEAKG